MSAGWWVPWVYFLYWSCGKWALDGEYCGFEPQLHLQIPRRQLRLKTACLFRKEVVATGYYPTNAPRGFHVETTWKGSFPRRFNVEYTWFVCRGPVNSDKLHKSKVKLLFLKKLLPYFTTPSLIKHYWKDCSWPNTGQIPIWYSKRLFY